MTVQPSNNAAPADKFAISLEELRALRARAKDLLRNTSADLKPFLHGVDKTTFLRTPTSVAMEKDVNVTTTCSCVMALALTGEFGRFYDLESNDHTSVGEKARTILQMIVDAPWMSSGLTANNAFTTTLVLRTLGFLVDNNLLDESYKELPKWWDRKLIRDSAGAIARELKAKKDFLYLSLSDKSRTMLRQTGGSIENAAGSNDTVAKALESDLRHVIHSGWIYEQSRFPSLSKNVSNKMKEVRSNPNVNNVAELNHQLLSGKFSDIEQPRRRSLGDIAESIAADAKHFSINEYPPSAAVVYWFVDGISRGKVGLPGKTWEDLCKWACHEFRSQHSLVLAGHDAMMDPVSAAMAACLCARLRSISAKADGGMKEEHQATLPSMVELEHSIKVLFRHQTKSGIWPKYFPLFHYQDAGSNFCFTFELLEAVLYEFGRAENELLDDAYCIRGLEKAVTWCEKNRLTVSVGNRQYTGWNSGGYFDTLRKGHPESWPTAVVHMFLWELENVLSQRIQALLLKKYNAVVPREEDDKKDLSHRLIDIDVLMSGSSKPASLIEVLKEMVDRNKGHREIDLRRKSGKAPMSALLFGPPGTSKTEVTDAVANALGWPRVVIDSSEFVKGTLANVFLEADRIFRDLMDLARVVVFFDEMDALIQSRADTHLDTATQFLTTSMLPHLANLYKNKQVVFFMATNYQKNLDQAIMRAGRFDLLLCMGPPTLRQKLEKLAMFFKDDESKWTTKDIEKLEKRIHEFTRGPEIRRQLDLYTFGEFKALLSKITKEHGADLRSIDRPTFNNKVKEFSKGVTLKLTDLPAPARRLRFDKIPVGMLRKVSGTWIGKYLRDLRESRKQY